MRYYTRFIILFVCFALPLFSVDVALETTDPVNLSTSWWSRFQDQPENKGNIEALITNLKQLRAQLPEENHPLTVLKVEQLILAAEQLQEKRSESIQYTPKHPLYLSKYTLSDWLKVHHEAFTLNQEKEKTDEQIASLRRRMASSRSELDQLALEYPLKRDGTVEKLKVGLQMMILRFQIELKELEIRRLTKIGTFITDDISKINEEKAIARDRLDYSDLSESGLKNNLERLDNLLVEASQNLLRLDKEIGIDPGHAEETLLSRIHVESIHAELIENKIKLLVAEIVHTDKSKLSATMIQNQLDNLSEEQTRLQEDYQHLLSIFQNASPAQLESYKKTKDALTKLKIQLNDNGRLLNLVEDKAIQKKSTFTQYFFWISKKLTEFIETLFGIFSIRLFRINDYPVTLWVILRAIGIFAFAIFLSQYFTNNLAELLQKKGRVGQANTYILSRILRYAFVALGAAIALYSIGVGMTNFIILAGALGVGVGLGLQAIVNNFFSGLVVLFSKLLKVGDIIETDGGFMGTVKAIRTQNTHIRTFEGKDVVIPNALLVSKNVVNWTLSDPYIRLKIPFNIAYGSNKEQVEEIVLGVANKFKFTVNNELICPKPKVWLDSFGDSSLNLSLIVWVNIRENSSRNSIRATLLWELEKELTNNGINIPYPHSMVFIKEFPELKEKKEP